MTIAEFEVINILFLIISFLHQFFDKVKRIINGIYDPIIIAVFFLINIAALKKEFQSRMKLAISYLLVHDAMLIIVIIIFRLINIAPP